MLVWQLENTSEMDQRRRRGFRRFEKVSGGVQVVSGCDFLGESVVASLTGCRARG